MTKHFLDITNHTPHELRQMIELAKDVKKNREKYSKSLDGKHLAMIFEKPSTRTRISFELAIKELGGDAVVLRQDEIHFGKKESTKDSSKVISSFCDFIMIRCFSHEMLYELATYSASPVVNGLSDYSHPCQIMAAILTFEERFGSVQGKTLSWVGDYNNVLRSYIHASAKFDYKLQICCPESILIPADEIAKGGDVVFFKTPKEAVSECDVIITDAWVSMGEEHKKDLSIFNGFQVNDDLVRFAKKDFLFSHCLPAVRGNEVSDSVIDSINSVVFEEAYNRLFAQKAILLSI